MQRLRPWLDAAKPEQASLAPLTVLAGAACASFDARPAESLVAPCLAVLAAAAAGIGINLVEEVWDAPGRPAPDPKKPVPEEARPLDVREAAGGAAIALGVAAVLGLAAAWLAGAALLGYGAAAVALGVWRRAPAVGADTLGFGLGDLATIAALGPLAMLAGFASCAGEGASAAFYAGLPLGLAAASAGYLRHFVRHAIDTELRRMTPVATLGEDRARAGIVLLPLLAALAIFLTRNRHDYAPSSWVAAVPLAVTAGFVALRLRGAWDDTLDVKIETLLTRAAIAAAAGVAFTFWTVRPT